jgi:hypothetical protein
VLQSIGRAHGLPIRRQVLHVVVAKSYEALPRRFRRAAAVTVT